MHAIESVYAGRAIGNWLYVGTPLKLTTPPGDDRILIVKKIYWDQQCVEVEDEETGKLHVYRWDDVEFCDPVSLSDNF